MNPKIKTQQEIVKIVEELKKQGKKIVTTNGSFDLLHVGHIKALQESKSLGDILIVGLNSDISIKGYKSKDRPIISQKDRAEMLGAIDCVDYITIFDELNPIVLLEKIKPHIHTNTASWGGEECIEAETVKRNGGRIHVLKHYEGYSTTDIINNILKTFYKKSKNN